jgi:GTPase
MDSIISKVNSVPRENHEGNTEYKWKLVGMTNERLENLVTQLKYRIIEGSGEAVYLIGIMDDGTFAPLSLSDFNETLETLKKMAARITCEVHEICKKQTEEGGWVGEYLVREANTAGNYVDLKLAVAGNVDSGKSTLIGTLTRGVLDDGRGGNRKFVFNYKHEIDTGRTTSVGHQIMGFDIKGNVINEKDRSRPMAWPDIVKDSSKIVSFYDMAGHEKYLRTTIAGMGCTHPDYAIILVGANMGVSHMTREHVALCLSLKIPFIIIITKVDIAPEDVYKETQGKITQIIRSAGVRKVPYNIKTVDDVIGAAKNMPSDTIVPIFHVSNVTGAGLEYLKKFFNLLPVRKDYSKFANADIHYEIDSTYMVTGVGLVLGGFLKSGTMHVGDKILVGPTSTGEYYQSQIKSIHVKKVNVNKAVPGHYTCVAVKTLQRHQIKRGMMIIDSKAERLAVREFTAQVQIFTTHSTTIRIGYEPFIHADNIRQSVKIIDIEKINKTDEEDKVLRTGDKALVKLRFIKKPEYITEGMRIVFREGKIRGIGAVVTL